MSKRRKKAKARRFQIPKLPAQLQHINLNAAGIDIGSERHLVAVPAGRDEVSVREFGTFTADLEALAAWLKKCGAVASRFSGVAVCVATSVNSPRDKPVASFNLTVILAANRGRYTELTQRKPNSDTPSTLSLPALFCPLKVAPPPAEKIDIPARQIGTLPPCSAATS